MSVDALGRVLTQSGVLGSVESLAGHVGPRVGRERVLGVVGVVPRGLVGSGHGPAHLAGHRCGQAGAGARVLVLVVPEEGLRVDGPVPRPLPSKDAPLTIQNCPFRFSAWDS